MRFLATAVRNVLVSTNGLPTINGLGAINGLGNVNGFGEMNGLQTINGLVSVNGLVQQSGGNEKISQGWNALFVPAHFSAVELGSNWIDSDLLGPLGVGDLENIPSVQNNILDNRHIPEELKMMLCSEDEGVSFREYFSALIQLAWPRNAEFWLCCSDSSAGANSAEACLEPDYKFTSEPEMEGLDPPVFAPHFLTEKFEMGQQEALTAALIAKFNVLGIHLMMDLHGRFDLGLGKNIGQ